MHDQWLQALPKIELHAHLDGSIRPQTLWALHQALIDSKNPSDDDKTQTKFQPLFESEIALARAINTGAQMGSTLGDFLNAFDSVLRLCQASIQFLGWETAELWFARFGRECVEDAAAENCVYFETRFCPFSLFMFAPSTEREADIDDGIKREHQAAVAPLDKESLACGTRITQAIARGLQEGVDASGKVVACGIILCSLWDHPAYSPAVVEVARRVRKSHAGADCNRDRDPHRTNPITCVGVDIAGNELGSDIAQEHLVAMHTARECDLGISIHAGMPHRNISQAVTELNARRVGHAYHGAFERATVDLLLRSRTHVECSLTPIFLSNRDYSNTKPAAFARYVDLGVSVAVSTDDRWIKNCTLLDELQLARDALLELWSATTDGSDTSEQGQSAITLEDRIKAALVKMQHNALAAAFIADENVRDAVRRSLLPQT